MNLVETKFSLQYQATLRFKKFASKCPSLLSPFFPFNSRSTFSELQVTADSTLTLASGPGQVLEALNPAQGALEVKMAAGSSCALRPHSGQRSWQALLGAGKQLSALRNSVWKGDVEKKGLGRELFM